MHNKKIKNAIYVQKFIAEAQYGLYILLVNLAFEVLLSYFQEEGDIHIAAAEDDGDIFPYLFHLYM